MNTTTTATDDGPIVLELLYLDLETCEPCRGASSNVDDAVAAVREQVEAAGRSLEVCEIHVTSRAQADDLGFVSSPTVRVNGVDLELGVQEASCGTCSAIVQE